MAVAVSLVTRPPAGCVAAADRLAVGLCVAFLFAPAGRFGYFALPLLLVVWSRLATGALPGARSPAPLLRRGAPPTERPAAASRATPAPRRAPVAALHGRR
ncbi:hypothetical protein ACW23B_27745 [Streptomyces albidoflavus]